MPKGTLFSFTTQDSLLDWQRKYWAWVY